MTTTELDHLLSYARKKLPDPNQLDLPGVEDEMSRTIERDDKLCHIVAKKAGRKGV